MNITRKNATVAQLFSLEGVQVTANAKTDGRGIYGTFQFMDKRGETGWVRTFQGSVAVPMDTVIPADY